MIRTIFSHHIRGTRGRVPCAELGRIALDVARGPTDLRGWREVALRGAARAALRVADRVVGKLAGRDVAAARRAPYAWVTVLARLDDAIAAHLEGYGLARWIGLDQAACVELGAPFRASHDRA